MSKAAETARVHIFAAFTAVVLIATLVWLTWHLVATLPTGTERRAHHAAQEAQRLAKCKSLGGDVVLGHNLRFDKCIVRAKPN